MAGKSDSDSSGGASVLASRRISFVIFLAVLLSAGRGGGNPIFGPANIPARVYITSEHLEVALSPAAATFKGTFTFAAQGLNDFNKDTEQVFMQLPIWFPQQKASNPAVNRFWDAFGTNMLQVIRPTNSAVLEKAIGLKVILGNEPVTVRSFAMLYQGGDQRPFQVFRFQEWQPFLENQEPGFCCLLFRVDGLGEFAKSNTPVTISYRQPLFEDAGGRRFFYMPFFENLPADISTADTNRYSVTLTAQGCSLEIATDGKNFSLKDGKSAILAPQNRRAIRASVR
jgi:hypothetical protein